MNKEEKQIERITEMENILNESTAIIEEMFCAIEKYKNVTKKIKKLEKYYTGPLYLKDLEDDQNGKIPKDLPRGVLSEDGIYNLLSENDQLQKELKNNTL